MKSYQRLILLIIIVAAAAALIRFTGVSSYMTMEYFQANKDILRDFVSNNYVRSIIAFILIYIAVTAFSIPGATILSLTSGFLFGWVEGTLYINAGATFGAAGSFLFARFFAGEYLQRKYGGALEGFNREMQRNGASYMLTVRLIPAFPFFMINILAGLTKLPLSRFIWTTSLGIIPGSAVYAFAGESLDSISSTEGILSGKLILALVLLGLLSLMPVIIRKFRKK